ncbi:MAG: c-type cytochrome [Candidatus Methylomirabilota bacterium]
MKRQPKLRTALFVSSLATLLVVGPVAAQTAPKVGSGDIVADRKRLMKLNGASMADLQAKVKAGNIEAVAVNAETIALNAMHIPALFPPGSAGQNSRARTDIWQKRAGFENAARSLQTLAEKLRDAAQAKDAAAVEAMAKTFGKQGCGMCHLPMPDGTIFGPHFRSLE